MSLATIGVNLGFHKAPSFRPGAAAPESSVVLETNIGSTKYSVDERVSSNLDTDYTQVNRGSREPPHARATADTRQRVVAGVRR
jgi:hypothetical protein